VPIKGQPAGDLLDRELLDLNQQLREVIAGHLEWPSMVPRVASGMGSPVVGGVLTAPTATR
jgi:hypothetical protein